MSTSLLENCNSLLRSIGLESLQFKSEDELIKNVSSLLVSLFENILGEQIENIQRIPKSSSDYISNLSLTISSLRSVLPESIPFGEVSAEEVFSGNKKQIHEIITVFRSINDLLSVSAQSSSGDVDLGDTQESVSAVAGDIAESVARSDFRNTINAGTNGKIAGSQTLSKSGVSVRPQSARPSQSTIRPSPARPQSASTGRSVSGVDNRETPLKSTIPVSQSSRRLTPAKPGSIALDPSRILNDELARKEEQIMQQTARRQQQTMARVMRKNAEELEMIRSQMAATIRQREASARVLEAKALASATARARVAKHDRRVVTLRARAACEALTAQTLSMRIARSSRQAAAASGLLAALATQQRLAAAEEVRQAAEERARELLDAQARLAWVREQTRLVNEVVLEETAAQIAQRTAAAAAQRAALRTALADMKVDQDALLRRLMEEQKHAEDVFLARHVESLQEAARAGGSGGRGALGAQGAEAIIGEYDLVGTVGSAAVQKLYDDGLGDQMLSNGWIGHDALKAIAPGVENPFFFDSDVYSGGGGTVERMKRAMKRENKITESQLKTSNDTIRRAAMDTGAALADADFFSQQAREAAAKAAKSIHEETAKLESF